MMPTLTDGSSVGVCDLPAKPSRQSRDKLTCNDLLFVNEYLANGRNATRAYEKVHPKCTYQSARRAASKLLTHADIRQELAKRVEHEAGITRELVETNLLHALKLANESKDAAVIASITMDCAKLGGYLIERKDVTTHEEGQKSAVTDLVGRSLRQAGKDGAN